MTESPDAMDRLMPGGTKGAVVREDGGSSIRVELGELSFALPPTTPPEAVETIERLLCDCALSVNGSSEARTFSPPMRRGLMGKHQHCQWPGGCERPVAWCEGHHRQSWLLNGKTRPENGMLLCGFHHRLVHEGGWRIEGEVAISPGGEKFRSAKAPPAA